MLNRRRLLRIRRANLMAVRFLTFVRLAATGCKQNVRRIPLMREIATRCSLVQNGQNGLKSAGPQGRAEPDQEQRRDHDYHQEWIAV